MDFPWGRQLWNTINVNFNRDAVDRTVFTDILLQGRNQRILIYPTFCVNFNDVIDEKASSILLNGRCAKIWRYSNCRGTTYNLRATDPCHEHLGICGFNYLISSVSRCDGDGNGH